MITAGSYHSYWSSLEPAGYHDNNDQQQAHCLMDKELMGIKKICSKMCCSILLQRYLHGMFDVASLQH
jgi:hypothetical protein